MKQILGLIVGYDTEGEIAGAHIVTIGEAEGAVKQAAAATDKIIGVSTRITTTAADTTDVIRSGIACVVYGDSVARGDALTADSQGRAVKASSGNIIVGFAETAGEEDELGSVFLNPGISAA